MLAIFSRCRTLLPIDSSQQCGVWSSSQLFASCSRQRTKSLVQMKQVYANLRARARGFHLKNLLVSFFVTFRFFDQQTLPARIGQCLHWNMCIHTYIYNIHMRVYLSSVAAAVHSFYRVAKHFLGATFSRQQSRARLVTKPITASTNCQQTVTMVNF